MDVTMNLSEQNAALDEGAPGQALGETLEQSAGQPLKPKKSASGLLAKYGPGPTEEEIDQNRREMFNGFDELAP